MLTEPADLDRGDLVSALRHWDLIGAELEYLPVGLGSHHWRADHRDGTPRFVTVDDLDAGFQAGPDAEAAAAALERAYRTAALLREEAGLEFVVAPLADDEGQVMRRVSERYAVNVLPFVEGASTTFGRYESAEERHRIARVLGRLHTATKTLPEGLPRQEDFAIPSRAELEGALADLSRRWSSGPFSELTRVLLRDHGARVKSHLRDYDVLVAHVKSNSEPWVITHGEPHRANVVVDMQGGVHLVDWDTTLVAPRERDLRMVLDDDLTGWEAYVSVAGPCTVSKETLDLYRRWWYLADIAIYVALFRRPHERTDDAEASWENLTAYVAGLS